MILSKKIKYSIESHPALRALFSQLKQTEWCNFTRTQFNLVAHHINKKITKEVIANPDLVEFYLIIGQLKMQQEMTKLRFIHVFEFIKYLNNMSQYNVFNWVSGKTLQSYWQGGAAKHVKINALLCFLEVPFTEWPIWVSTNATAISGVVKLAFSSTGITKSALDIVKNYYLGNYYLYYQKTDNSPTVIKTPFVLKAHESGQVIVKSVSEGHRYSGKVTGLRDGCLYINCQNLDFEEMEQYVFNIGLETRPEVLFGVSTTVSVKNRQAVALRNILVKQKNTEAAFENESEIEVPFSKNYIAKSEEATIIDYLKRNAVNVLVAPACCRLSDMNTA